MARTVHRIVYRCQPFAWFNGPRGRLTRSGVYWAVRGWRWETGGTPIPVYLPLALLWIRHTRRTMQGNNYPLMADVQRLMLDEDIDQDTAVRSFGAAP